MSLGHKGNNFSFEYCSSNSLFIFFFPADLSVVKVEVSSSSWTLWELK